MELRGVPGLGTALAPGAALLGAAGGGAVAWATVWPDRRLAIFALSAAIVGAVQLLRALVGLARQRRAADDWLRTATGTSVPPRYEWRARYLTSARERRMLARTLREVEQLSVEQPVGGFRLVPVTAASEHRVRLLQLASQLERVDEPVTPAGILRVVDLVTTPTSPLWSRRKDAELGDAISATRAALTPRCPA